jgi:HD domain
MRHLPRAARVYVGGVVALGIAVATPGLAYQEHIWAIVVIAALYLLVDSVSTLVINRDVSLSMSFPVGLAAVILLPPSGAAIVVLMGALAHNPTPLTAVKRAFNGAELALAAFVSGMVYQSLGGPRVLDIDSFPAVLVPVVAAIAVYYLVNGLLLASVVALTGGMRFAAVWRSTLSESLLPYLSYSLLGLMMAVLWSSGIKAFAAVLVLLPLFVTRWAFAQSVEQRRAYAATLRTLVQAVETKDWYTRGHSERVSAASVLIADRLGMRANRLEALRYAGLLHDVGKLGVPTRLLQKSGPLTEAELGAVQLHPVRGVEMIREIAFLDEAVAGILHHHERMDGLGYPMGLRGRQIPEFARIIAVADAFDSMTSTRSYRRARTVPEAVAEVRRCAGAQFDPRMAEALAVAVTKSGWQPATGAPPPSPPPPLPAPDVPRPGYDHDDPTTVLPVVRRPDR